MKSPEDSRARVDALFAQALDRPAAQRPGFLAEACGEDAALRAEVEELLRFAGEPAAGLGTGAVGSGRLLQELSLELESGRGADTAGERIGPWRPVRELGRGGMGTVYLAERADGGFEQTVALKLLRAGADSEEILRRFEQERQILASLHHPNIAQLFDGGRAGDGRPYFAMEYVEGRSIDRYCDERQLSIDQRLELFERVGRAVQHAHRNLVVHRDLKPSNIVVTGDGEVKLLDFGIAKVLDPARASPEPLTRTVARVLTPEYASPEQVLGRTITTASDVYQLGLLLYELLTGQRAHRIEDTAPSALEQAVCVDEPTRPSTAVTGDGTDASALAARATTAEALARKLRGDLDNIVLMALRKEPERRYGSVDQLLADLERFRRRLPVSARSDTAFYRLDKFMRRHPFGVAAAAVITLLLVGYAWTVTYQARRLAEERDRVAREASKARHVAEFLTGLFEAADPYKSKGDQLTAGELVEAGIRQARKELDEQPEVKAEMLGVLGEVAMSLSQYDAAEELLAEALALERQLHPGDHPDLARALARRAQVLRERYELEASTQLSRETLEMRRRIYGEQHEEVVSGISALGVSMLFERRSAEAEDLFRQALTLQRTLSPEPSREVATLLNDLGVALKHQDRYAAAEEAHREALALRRGLFDTDHPDLSESLNNLAVTLMSADKLAEAEGIVREALEIRRRIFGDDHVRVANTLNNLGHLLRRMKRFREAEAAHREALAIRRAALGGEHSNVGLSLENLAAVLRDRGDLRQAERFFGEALAMYRRTLPEDHGWIADAALALGRLLGARDELERAESLLVEALTLRLDATGEDSLKTAEARLALGICRAAQGREEEARDLLAAGLDRPREASEGDRSLVAEAQRALAGLAPPAAATQELDGP